MSFGGYQPYLLLALLLWLVLTLARSAGRLAPRAALAPLVFLVSRWPVLAAWAVGATAMVWTLVPPALAHGHDTLPDFALLAGLSLFSGLGLAIPFVAVPFLAIRSFAKVPRFELEPGEVLLKEVVANHFLNGEARGGKLRVTTRRLVFRPHRYNIQLTPWSVALDDLASVEASGRRLLVVATEAVAERDWLTVADAPGLARFLGLVSNGAEGERPQIAAAAGT